MKLIIGLGNPGKKYEKSRHNFGFMAIDHIQKNLGVFEPWTLDNTANALISKGQISENEILLIKPQTFMNLSGTAVQKLRDFYKIEPKNIFIIHDDFDLPLGVIRISQSASPAGHKGVKSIIEMIGTKEFIRFRLGIRPIGRTFITRIFNKLSSIEKFVLKNFTKEELPVVDQIIKKNSFAIETALKESLPQAMNQFN